MKDPLDLFNGFDIKSKRQQALEDPKDYPGGRAPKSRRVVDSPEHEWLNELRAYEYAVNGVPQKFYTVGSLAKVLNRSTVTIRSWESKGWIPPASFRTPTPNGEQAPGKAVRGRRLYSEAQLVFLVEAAMTYKIDHPKEHNWDGFRRHIASNYPRH